MKRKTNKKSVFKSILLVIVGLLVCSLAAGAVYVLFKKPDSGLTEYTASAQQYQNLQKFAYFADENGDVVSKENPYIYTAESEQALTPVYEDFVNVKVQVSNSGQSAWGSDKYTAVDWYDLGYLTEPLKQGMSVSFDFIHSQTTLFGVSTLERIENSVNYGWGTKFQSLFVPEINYYSSTESFSCELYPLNSELGGQSKYGHASLTKGGNIYCKNCSGR